MSHFASDLRAFLDRLFAELATVGLDTATLLMDHVCFRTETAADYAQTKAAFAEFSRLLIESDVNGRPIATYRLNQPIVHRGRIVSVVEVPAPKAGKSVQRGYEHAEFVIGESFQDFAQRHPALPFEFPSGTKSLNTELGLKLGSVNVKFHHLPLDGVIELERDSRRLQAAAKLGVFAPLARFEPQFSGSMLLALGVPGSAVDVLFDSPNLDEFDREAATCLMAADQWRQRRTECDGEPTSLYHIECNGLAFGWSVQAIPVHRQIANRHLLVEARLLNVAGEGARQAIRDLKAAGMKTEPAFAHFFGITGDPYAALLALEGESEAALLQRFSIATV